MFLFAAGPAANFGPPCLPRGHGTPQVTPVLIAGAFPSSQRAQAPGPGLVSAIGGAASLAAGVVAAGGGDAGAAVGANDAAAVPDRPAAMNSRRESELPDMRSLEIP